MCGVNAPAAEPPRPIPTPGQNEAPVLDITKSPVLLETCAGLGPPVNGTLAGSPIALLVDAYLPVDGVDNVLDTDAAENETAWAQLGIALTSVSAGGTWYYTTNNCATWNVVTAVSSTTALLLAADAATRLYFHTATGTTETSIQFRAWDRSSGSNGSQVNTTINGGTTAFSINTDVATGYVFGIRQVATIGSPASAVVSVPFLSSAQAGDVIVLFIANSTAQTVSAPQFTTVLDQVQTSPTTSRLYVGWRVRTASEPTYSVTLGASTAYVACSMALPGLNTSGASPAQVFASQATPAGFAHTAPAVLPTVIPAFITSVHEFANSVAWTPPVGMTEAADRASSGATISGVSMELNQVFRTSAGTTGPYTAQAATTFAADAGATATVAWQLRNSAPMLDNTRAPVLNPVAANAPPPNGPVGTLVSALIDPANTSGGMDNLHDLNGASAYGIAVTAAYVANGSWYYSLNNGGSWGPLGIPSNTVCRLLAADANTRVYFQAAPGFSTDIPAALTFRAWDMTAGTNGGTANPAVNGGSTPFSFAKDVASLAFVANLPPLNAVPGPQTTEEDLPIMLSSIDGTALSVSDPDAGPSPVQVSLAIPQGSGALYMGNTFGITFTAGADGTSSMTFTGSVASISSALDGLLYVPAPDHSGTTLLTISTNDLGNSGSGGPLSDVDFLPINVIPMNDPPVELMPLPQTTQANTPLVFSAANDNALSIADVDAGTSELEVTLDVTNGTCTLGAPTALDFSIGDGTSDASMIFTATLAEVNAAIAQVTFVPTPDQGGPASLSITVNDQGNTGAGGAWVTTGTVDILVTTSYLTVSPRVMLEGPYNAVNGLMNDALRAAGLLPAQEPYSALGYVHIGGGGETTTAPVLAIAGNNAIVDWVVVELRALYDPAVVLATHGALLQRDGDVVAMDGASPVEFSLSAGIYYVAVRHRNHLGGMTEGSVHLNISPVLVDFTSISTAMYGLDARRSINGTFQTQALWTGDVNLNKAAKYTGSSNDRDPILVAVGSTSPNNIVNGLYNAADLNLDGTVKYTGTGNDRDRVLQTVGSTSPNNVRPEQLP